ncbi:hypothetical protein J6590_083628 [Homalodisca vitripennis]|nr:hypothetical protein J6590_083628 [Homalodisca vitripennis]
MKVYEPIGHLDSLKSIEKCFLRKEMIVGSAIKGLCHHNDTEYFQICQDCQWQIVRKRKRSAEPERADIVRCGSVG